MNIKIISAGAGSGKTYRLTSEMVRLLREGGVRADGIIATTFTQKAAAELQERVRVRLLEEGLTKQADELTNALIGTVHGLGVRLLKRFAYEAGVSPAVDIIAEEDQQVLFNQSLATVLTSERVEAMEHLVGRFGSPDRFDWRKEVRRLTEVARANDFGPGLLEQSRDRSIESFGAFLDEPGGPEEEECNRQLKELLEEAVRRLHENEDETKKTKDVAKALQNMARELTLRGWLPWPDWARLSKLSPGAKSRDDVEELTAFAARHAAFPSFQQDIRDFIGQLFDIARDAIHEYDEYKKRRGLIDYTDMEVLVKRLLDQEPVRRVLAVELDLLMVDEFQDTSPLQLEIFLKLSRLARHSIWVGDPKQSIYGFRGADPALMQAIIDKMGGIKPEDIQEYSWRSREDIVYATNALFTKAFPDLPPEQVALKPRRRRAAAPDTVNKENEPIEVDDALIHWHFRFDGEGRRQPGRPWMENCLAETLKQLLSGRKYVLPKDGKTYRPARPGDVAVLCRSNSECEEMAGALARAGLRVAVARAGLLKTAEARLVLACLKYILNRQDSLSIAEILLLAGGWTTERIIEQRLDYLRQTDGELPLFSWGADQPVIRRLDDLRDRVVELSSAEILNLLLEELDLRRIVVGWGNPAQRLDNVDVLRRLALQYEAACNRLHSAASLGGFLLWVGELAQKGEDRQGPGEGPDAVNVLTYHKSKGLEWPVVICHSLEGPLRADLWGIDIVSERDDVDFGDVLGGRWLRYWVNPYGPQYRGTAVYERMSESPEQALKSDQARREETRLLYVGLTRARDYLIFPSSGTATRWLNRVWHGADDTPTLLPDTHESPWTWNGHAPDIYTETFPYPKDFTQAEPPEESLSFHEHRSGKQNHRPYRIDLREESLNGAFQARLGSLTEYAGGAVLKEEADEYGAAKLIKAFLTGFEPEESPGRQAALAEAFLGRFGAHDWLEARELLRLGSRYYGYLEQQYTFRRQHRKYPVRYLHEGRLFETIVDLLLETDRGLVLIQNSGFAGDVAKTKSKALTLGDWLFLSRGAVQELFDEPRVRTLVHFVLSGRLVEVECRPV